MQSRCLPVETVVRGARWGLPWICVLAISTCLAYAMAVAVAGGSYAGDSLTTITVVPAEIASGRVIIVPKGVWNRDQIITLYMGAGNSGSNSMLLDQNKGKVEVPVTTVDHLVEEWHLPRVEGVSIGLLDRRCCDYRTRLCHSRPDLGGAGTWRSAYEHAD